MSIINVGIPQVSFIVIDITTFPHNIILQIMLLLQGTISNSETFVYTFQRKQWRLSPILFFLLLRNNCNWYESHLAYKVFVSHTIWTGIIIILHPPSSSVTFNPKLATHQKFTVGKMEFLRIKSRNTDQKRITSPPIIPIPKTINSTLNHDNLSPAYQHDHLNKKMGALRDNFVSENMWLLPPMRIVNIIERKKENVFNLRIN